MNFLSRPYFFIIFYSLFFPLLSQQENKNSNIQTNITIKIKDSSIIKGTFQNKTFKIKDSSIIKGTFQNKTFLFEPFFSSVSLEISAENITKIICLQNQAQIFFINGDRLTGSLKTIDFKINSSFGILKIETKNIKSIEIMRVLDSEQTKNVAEKLWKEASKKGEEGLRLYQEGLKLRSEANGDSTSPKNATAKAKFKEALSKLAQACKLGNKAILLELCVQLGMSIDESKAWVARYKKEGDLEDFDEFLTSHKKIPETKKGEIIQKWRKSTGEFQDEMGKWQEKIYDINKNIRFEDF